MYCSRTCAFGRPMSPRLPMSERACVGCGKKFSGSQHQRYCSKSCRLAHYWERVGRLKNRAHVQRVKAQRSGTAHEFIDPVKVFVRDKWTCRLCRTSIDQFLKHPHPLSATVDHIMPMALGGPHTWGNVQAAHFRCNNSKNTKFSGQLLLRYEAPAQITHWEAEPVPAVQGAVSR